MLLYLGDYYALRYETTANIATPPYIYCRKYYNRDNNKEVKGTENCDEEQTQQLRSRTALTRKGPSSRLLGNSLMKRI